MQLHLSYRQKSFENLRNIATHPTLHKYVLRILYEGDHLADMQRDHWERCIPLPRQIPLSQDVGCFRYDLDDNEVTVMPGKHWERVIPQPFDKPLPPDIIVPPYAFQPNFSPPLNASQTSIFIGAYNQARHTWRQKLIPRLLYTEQQLDDGYKRFKEEVERNQDLVEMRTDYPILSEALKCFPNLRTVEVFMADDLHSEELRTNFKHTLIFPHALARKFGKRRALSRSRFRAWQLEKARQVESTLLAIAKSGVKVNELHCGTLPWTFFLGQSVEWDK